MKISITNEKQNPFLKRKELNIYIEHAGETTPSGAALEVMIEKELAHPKEKIDIQHIFSETGKAASKASVFVWDEKKPEKKKKKGEVKQEEAKPVEAKKEKKEEKKEEKEETKQ